MCKLQSIAGVGIDWTFVDGSTEKGGLQGFIMKAVGVAVSIGGMLVTALMLGLVSGK